VFSGALRISNDASLGHANGSVLIAGGTLRLDASMSSARSMILGNAGGSIDTNGHDLAISGAIGGPGGLTKAGAGALVLTGNSNYSGSTSVANGRLQVDGSIVGNVSVAPSAELGGSGAIGGNVVNRGRLTPSGTTHALTVVGDVSFEAGSVYSIQADAAGGNGKLVASSVQIGDAAVEVQAAKGNYRRDSQYTIISAQNGVAGRFSSATANLPFLDPSLTYDANHVYLTLRRNYTDYEEVSLTPNQAAVGRAFTDMQRNMVGDAETVLAALDMLSATEAQAAYDAIGNGARSNAAQANVLNQRSLAQNVVNRLGSLDIGGARGGFTAQGPQALQVAFNETDTKTDAINVLAAVGGESAGVESTLGRPAMNGFWLRGYGGSGHVDGDIDGSDPSYRFAGAILGYDTELTNGVTVGALAGYAEPRVDDDPQGNHLRAENAQLGLYGRVREGQWHFDGLIGYSWNQFETSRAVSVGALERTATAKFRGHSESAYVEAGYTVKGAFDIQPLIGMQWVRDKQKAHSEEGAGALNLAFPDSDAESLRSSLGVRLIYPFETNGGVKGAVEVSPQWLHEFRTPHASAARFEGDVASDGFTIAPQSMPRDSAALTVGVSADFQKKLRVYADINGEMNGALRAYGASAGVRYFW
jgi:autotransporter-associated beta strand protein